jgi:hypothetical protein
MFCICSDDPLMQINCFYSGGMPSDALYRELWHACAGPLVTVPRQGERVYYFPQGHMEQVFTGLINLVFCGASVCTCIWGFFSSNCS